MRARTNKLMAVALVGLGMASASLFVLTRDEPKADVDPNLFKFSSTEEIDKVSLVSDRSSVELVFENNRWRVNGRWDADPQMIRVLFATLKQVEPRRPVAKAQRDSLRKWLRQKGTYVTLSSAGKSRLSFIAGGSTTRSEAWFMREGDDNVYVMMIPGYRVYVSGVFELDESGWRNKRIFDFNWRNFRSLTAAYPRDPGQGFTVEMKGRVFGIREVTEADTTRLNNYLDAVSLLFASRFVSTTRVRDSLASVLPAARIEIVDVAERKYGLDLFAPGKNDPEVLGKAGDNIVSLQRSDVEQIVRRKDWFKARSGPK